MLALSTVVALVGLVSASCRKRAPPPPVADDPPPPPVDTSPISQPRAFDGVADASVQAPSGGAFAGDLPPIDSNVPEGCSGRHVPLCFEAARSTKCCTLTKAVTYANCTRATAMKWQCPTGKVLESACSRDTQRCDFGTVTAITEYAPHKIVTDGTPGDGFSYSISATTDFSGNGTSKSELKYKGTVITDRLVGNAYGPGDDSVALYCESSPSATFFYVAKTKKKVKVSDECPTSVVWDLEDGTALVKLPKRSVTLNYR